MLKKLFLTIVVAASSVYAAHQLEVNVNDREIEGGIRIDMGRMGSMSNTYIGAKFLNGDNNNSKTIQDPDPLWELSYMAQGYVTGVPGMKLGLGVKGVRTTIGHQTFMALPLGAEAELRLPLNTPFPFYLCGALYYAPSVLAFKDGDEYLETRIHLDAEPIQNGRLEVGYRIIDTDLTHQNITYNDAWYFGLRLDF